MLLCIYIYKLIHGHLAALKVVKNLVLVDINLYIADWLFCIEQ